jgi:hypothetical protein
MAKLKKSAQKRGLTLLIWFLPTRIDTVLVRGQVPSRWGRDADLRTVSWLAPMEHKLDVRDKIELDERRWRRDGARNILFQENFLNLDAHRRCVGLEVGRNGFCET